ncbi:uncharacterized protein LOC132194246 [Neocloeon triangulifer]|uniref:uncharacterized protein LOC132194246 n=1 Tax=Neocloeon triangulifer TaxID=2078957 RepID=UPI00286F0F13|nr:uncharacterized protein LOC132194246 [Neocloeon triangulifer]
MDFIKKFFGIPPPQKYNDGYYYWGTNPPTIQDLDEFKNFPHPNQPWQREMEQNLGDILGQYPGFFSEVMPRFFEDFQSQPPLPPVIDKSDKVLDGSSLTGDHLMAIMEEDRQKRNYQHQAPHQDLPLQFPQLPPGFKSFSRSISIQTTQRPDGVWETRKVVRDGEGSEQVTVTEQPDPPSGGSTFFSMIPQFGAECPNPPKQDQNRMSLFEKVFRSF